MSFLIFLLLGLIAGALAKLILPGKQGGGWITTLILGVIGALLGGFIGGVLFGADTGGLNFVSILWSVIGAIIVLVIWGFITKRRA